MGIGIKLLGGGGGGGGGIKKVADATARLALPATDGLIVIQLDTDVLYEYDGTSSSWLIIGAGSVPISISDTSTIDLTLAANNLSGVVLLSPDAAAANNLKVDLNAQANGIRAQITYASIRGILSASAPLSYNSATGDFSIPVATDSVDGYLSATDHASLTTVIAGLAAHLADTTDAHDASAISYIAGGTVSSTDVQAAIAEVASEADTRLTALEAVSHVAVTLTAFGSTPNANGLSLSTQALNMQPADATNPGGVSTAQQNFGGTKSFGAGVRVGTTGALTTSTIFEIVSTAAFSVPMPVMTTTQRNAIASPGTGMMLYNSTVKHPEFYNGTLFEPIGHSYVNSTATISSSGTITPVDSRKQLLPLVGNAAAVTAADIAVTTALNGDELILIGTDDTNTVTVVSATNTVLNGSFTMALGYVLTLVHLSGKWYEKSRSH